jgi:hypothetical protein
MNWCRRVESTRRSWTAVACLLQRREHSIVGDLLELGLAALTALIDDIEPDGILLPLYESRCRNRGYNDDCDGHPLDGLLRLGSSIRISVSVQEIMKRRCTHSLQHLWRQEHIRSRL